MNDTTPAGAPRKSYVTVMALAAIAALVGFAAVYGTLGRPDNNGLTASGEKEAAKTASGTRRTAPDMPAFVFKNTPEPLAEVNFTDGDGNPMSLADFKGKTVLLNLWATWCAPCIAEFPELQALHEEFSDDGLRVWASTLTAS